MSENNPSRITPCLWFKDQAEEAARYYCAILPDSRIAVMPGQRHAAMDTGTELFTTEVLGFLSPAR